MAKLRLFANLREIAGGSRFDVPGQTVSDVISEAERRFGDEFERGVAISRIWVNGEEAEMASEVGEGDEIVVLPPVSGGAQPVSLAPELTWVLPSLAALVLVLANTQSQAIWVAALVAVAAAWAMDISTTFTARNRLFAPLAVVVSAAGAGLAAHSLGGAGYGLAIAIAILVALGWAVSFPMYRQIEVYSPTFMVSLLAALATASLVLSRSAFSPSEQAPDVFLVVVIAALALGALVMRLPGIPYLDPFSVTAVVAVLSSVGAAAFWDLDVVGYLLTGLGVAVALVAGNGLSSILRWGRVALTERAPGGLAAIDGAVLAAVIFYPLIRIIL